MAEIIITIAILAAAGFIFYKNVKKSSKGECNCGSCSAHCPKYNLGKNNK